jgi:putative transposase
MMQNEKQEQLRQQIADFRYSVVGELCNCYMSKSERAELIREKSRRSYTIPGSSRNTLSEATIRNWTRRCRKLGRDGLLPKQREDKGRPRAISDRTAQLIVEQLEAEPELTARAAVKKLQQKGKLDRTVSSSALSRFIRGNNLTRKERRRQHIPEDRRRFAFDNPLECVQADAMHGFPVPDEKGKKRKAILLAFIDDCTRRILYGRFHFSEKSLHFEDGIRHILKSHGKIGTLYTDNGATFVSSQTKRITTVLGIHLTHSRPYKPQGRGKVERFFRTVRDGFLRPLDKQSIKSLEQLNTIFITWLETEYHRSRHSSLGVTPIEAWLNKAERIRPVDPAVDLDRIFLHCEKRKVYQDSVFSLHGRIFEAPQHLIGKTVTLFFNPHPPLSKVLVTSNGTDYGEARPVDLYANTKVKREEYSRELTSVEEPDEETSDIIKRSLL